jgi:transglutaminase-like putative cysteine protease
MTVRLRPRSDCWQKLHQFKMEFDPSPKGISDSVDLDGNSTSFLWFSENCPALTINTTSWVETLRDNPFDYVLGDNSFFELPAQLSDYLQISLGPYLHRSHPSDRVDAFARGIAEQVNLNTVNFLSTLCTHIHEKVERTLRETGDPLLPEELLEQNKGACRDLTVLFMDTCRSMGLPTRFTSGYFYGDESFFDRQLHAWAEVYLPGGGWRGYDPSIGLAVADHHVAVASAPIPLLTAPTAGSYRGDNVESSIDFDIKMDVADSLEELMNPQPVRRK